MTKEPEPLLLAVNNPEGWSRPARRRAVHILFDDGGWRMAKVLGWLHDPRRGWLVELQWPGGGTEWRLYDRRYIHPVLRPPWAAGRPGDISLVR